MDERIRFVLAVERREASFAELCRQHGISREAGYRVMRRYEEEGLSGLARRSKAPHHSPHQMTDQVRELLLALRHERPRWGPKKLKAYIETREAEKGENNRLILPAVSTIGDLLHRQGLVHARRKRSSAPPATEPLAHAQAPHDVWSIDYKGWFKTGDGKRCDPLTITDNVSRYLIRIVAMPEISTERVLPVMEAAFREQGLPLAIRSDNGAPFASQAPGGLSQLSVWWTKLGIRHERIEPGKPQQNGRHERFHWTLLQDQLHGRYGGKWVEWDWQKQQRNFVRYRQEFNEMRPHEALGMMTPAKVHTCSPRRYSGRAPQMEYNGEYEARQVGANGTIAWKGKRVPITPVLAGERVGLREEDEELYVVNFGPVFLGWLEGHSGTFVAENRAARWAKKAGGRDSKGGGEQVGAMPEAPVGVPPDGCILPPPLASQEVEGVS